VIKLILNAALSGIGFGLGISTWSGAMLLGRKAMRAIARRNGKQQ